MTELTKAIIKVRPDSQGRPGPLRLFAAFMAGMLITAALAQAPMATNMLLPRTTEEHAVPVAPYPPGSLEPGADRDAGHPSIIVLV